MEILELSGGIQHYSWGKYGEQSLISKMLLNFSEKKPYAEYWLGIHLNNPAKVKNLNNTSLLDVLENNPTLLGDYTLNKWGTLPFLLKVLSIAHPLSIQAHPDQSLAKILHKKDPINYPDENHKPEIALAVSELEILYGFQPIEKKYRELIKIFDENNFNKFYQKLISLKEKERQDLLEKILNYLQRQTILSFKEKLFIELYPKYLNDIGLILLLLMQDIRIKPYEALFIEPMQLHAYLKGDLIECMANSDNTIRGGLTTKFQDINQLKKCVINNFSIPYNINTGVEFDQFIRKYPTNAEEFELQILNLPKKQYYLNNPLEVPMIILVMKGIGVINEGAFNLQKGSAFFIAAGCKYTIFALENLEIIRALVPKY